MTTLLFAKVACTFIIFLLNSVATFSTFLFTRARCHSTRSTQRAHWLLSYVNCFSIGLFLSVCFLGLYNSSCQKILTIQKSLDETNVLRSYPLSEAILCLGFFALWMFECISYSVCLRTSSNRILQSKRKAAPGQSFLNTSYIPLNEDVDNEVILCSEQDLPPHPTENNDMASEEDSASNSSLRSFFLVAAMSLHTILEALGFGLLDTTPEVIHMAVAMALHQILCSSALGTRLAQAKGKLSKNKYAFGILVGYLSLLPIGALSASAIYTAQHPTLLPATGCSLSNVSCPTQISEPSFNLTGLSAMALLQNFAAATFLYVIFVELLPSQVVSSRTTCASHNSAALRNSLTARRSAMHCLFGLVGFLLISGLRFVNYH